MFRSAARPPGFQYYQSRAGKSFAEEDWKTREKNTKTKTEKKEKRRAEVWGGEYKSVEGTRSSEEGGLDRKTVR